MHCRIFIMIKRLVFFIGSVIILGQSAMADVASVGYVIQTQNQLANQIITKADDDTVVHNVGDEMIAGVKTFSDGIVLENAPDDASNDHSVATTLWTNQHIDSAKGQVPVGSADSKVFIPMWMEE